MHSSAVPTTNTTHARFEARTMPVYIQQALSNLYPTKVWKSKGGAGFCLPSYDLDGCSILDLGCADGRDVYIATQLVGQNGSVVGVDMSIEQLRTSGALNVVQNAHKNFPHELVIKEALRKLKRRSYCFWHFCHQRLPICTLGILNRRYRLAASVVNALPNMLSRFS